MSTSSATELRPDWEQWQGDIVDGRFRLERLLVSDKDGAFFTTSHGSGPATIKVVLARNEELGEFAQRWSEAARLDYPHLMKIFASGTGMRAGQSLGYVVMDHAEENLGAVLADRALTPDEVLEMLVPISSTLVFLHARGSTLGGLSPLNVFAVQDVLKISSDAIGRGDASTDLRAVAETMIEALTRRPIDVATLPEPFLEIARRCFGTDGRARWSAADLASWLAHRDGDPTRSNIIHSGSKASKRTLKLSSVMVVLGIVLIAILTVGSLFRNRQTSVQPVRSAPPDTSKEASGALPRTEPQPPAVAQVDPPRPVAAPAATPVRRGTTVDQVAEKQVLPAIPPKAVRTIRGKATLVVKVVVDQSGEVREATTERGGSRYFGRLAEEAARGWRFIPSDTAAPREYFLRFEITRTGTKASVLKTR